MKKILLLFVFVSLSQFLIGQRVPIHLNIKNLQKAEMLSAPINNPDPNAQVLPKDYDNSIYSVIYNAPTTPEKYVANSVLGAIPITEIKDEGDWTFLPGAFMKNVGNLNLTGSKVSVVINHYPLTGGAATKMYDKTSTERVDIEPDSIRGLTIDPFDFKNGKGIGRYQYTYTVAQDSVDQTKSDNSYVNNMYVTKNLLSKSKANPTTKAPIVTQFWGGGTDYREVLFPFSLKHGKGLFVDTLYTAIASNDPLPGIALEGRLYKFEDKNADGEINNDEMTLVAIGSYVVPATATGNSINVKISLDNLVGSTTHYQIEEDGQLYFASVLYPGGSASLFNAYEMERSHRMLINIKESAVPSELQYEDYPYLSVRSVDAGTGGPDMSTASLFYVDLNGDGSAQDEEIFFFPCSMSLELSGVVGTKDLAKENQIQVTVDPNPAKEIATVHAKLNIASKVKFELFNSSGKLIETEVVNEKNSEFNKTYQVQSLPEGTYIVKVTSDTGSARKAFVVVK